MEVRIEVRVEVRMERGMSKIVTHAGCEGTIPNSWQYIEKAMESDCDVIELDVRKYDGKLLLSHDCIQPERIIYNQSCQVDSRYVTFEEAAIRICQETDKLINCDLKEDILMDVIDMARQIGIEDRLIFTGTTNIKVCDLPGYRQNRKQIFLNVEGNDCNLDVLEKTGARGINIEYNKVTKTLVNEVHKRDLELYVGTVDKEEQMEKMLDLGVDGITSNRIERLMKTAKGMN